ncbi:unnamed protein product, partial [Meganyctiphanes norvegica]
QMSSQQSTSPLARVLLILLLLQAEAQWMNDEATSQRSFNREKNPWQSRNSDTNTRLRISRLRSPTYSENFTDIVGTKSQGEDDFDVATKAIFVESSNEEVINKDEETLSQMENTTVSINRRNITRERKPIDRMSKVDSNNPSFGQGRNQFVAALPPVPTGPFNNPLGPTPPESSTRAWARPIHGGQAPGSLPPSVPSVLAPAPPIGPPSPPPTNFLPPGGLRPPAIPTDLSPGPGPPPTSDTTEITDIQCRNGEGGSESFSAVLALPKGFEAVPVFEDAPAVDATTNPYCRMIPTQLVGMFELFVSNFKQCGVTECRQGGGEKLVCLVLRFPLMTGIKLPEDTIIEIRCKPQEKTAEDNSIIRVATSKYADRNPQHEGKTPSVFEGGGHEFECNLELFSKLKGTELFQKKIGDNEEVDLGEEIQLRSEVRNGDGWEYSRMTEVVIQRVGGSKLRSSFNTAVLVFSDGCRNPEFKVIAKNHPQRDRNALVVNFNLRVFMFQDMIPGDSLMISAKVIGCVDEADCQPILCADDKKNGYGKRKKRSSKEITITKEIAASKLLSLYPPTGTRPERSTVDLDSTLHGSTTDWDRSFGIRVRFPEGNSSPLVQESLEAMECRSYLFITMGVATFFCFITFIFAMVLFYRSRPKVIPVQMPPQIIESEIKRTALSPSVSNNVMLKEDHIQVTTFPSSNVRPGDDSLEGNELQQPNINSHIVASPVRQRMREVDHNTKNVNENTNPTQTEDLQYSCHPKENASVTVTRRPSAVIRVNSNESNKRPRNTIKRQPSTVIRINDNETHTTIFNQKPTPKPRLSKENNE